MPVHTYQSGKIKTLTTPSAGEDVGQQEHSFIAGGNAKWYNYCGIWFTVSYKIKHTLPIYFSNHIPRYLLK